MISFLIILAFEIVFIFINSTTLPLLYSEVSKENLKKDVEIVKVLAADNHKERYKDVFKNVTLRFTAIDTQGNVVYDSRNPEQVFEMANHLDRKEVRNAIDKGEGFDIRNSSTFDKKYAYYSQLITDSEGKDLVIRVASDYSKEDRQVKVFLFLEIIFFIIFNFILYFFYKNYLRKDFENKLDKIQKFIIEGEDKSISNISTDPWLHNFWITIKEWQLQNLKNVRKIEQERKTLDLIISSVDIFIGLLDAKGNFKVRNKFAEYLLNHQRENYLESFKYIELINPIKNSVVNKESLSKEIYIDSLKKYFLLNVKYIEFNSMFLITIKDITLSKERGEIEKTFMTNMGHELKTPLTNIKGYLIALSDDISDEETKVQFMDIIRSNVNKMDSIIENFIDVSKLETNSNVNLEYVSLDSIKSDIEDLLRELLISKNITIEYETDLSNSNDKLFIDKEKIIIILKNLIENGIKYNLSDNPTIKVKISEDKDNYLFSVEDNGIGIPNYEFKNIFNKFHRSKTNIHNISGTGLGLFIVKEFINKCGGEIYINSEEGMGSTFTFNIKKLI